MAREWQIILTRKASAARANVFLDVLLGEYAPDSARMEDSWIVDEPRDRARESKARTGRFLE